MGALLRGHDARAHDSRIGVLEDEVGPAVRRDSENVVLERILEKSQILVYF